MSAICGRLHLDGSPIDPRVIDGCLAVMARYGPDGARRWYRGSVALGHCLQVAVPESIGERQPTARHAPDLVITGDVRLDNRAELAEALGVAPAECRDWPDAQYALAAYARWGVACVGRLLGDFAFAIWDGHRRRLLLARDFIGARPLYYAADGARIAFASDIAGALYLAELPKVLDLVAVRQQLHFGTMQDKERTFYDGLKKLPPATVLVAETAGIRRHRYWRPEDVRSFDPGSEEDTIEQVRGLLSEATRCRTRAVKAVGAHASGGLDSTMLAAIAARALRESNRSLTAINWAPPFSQENPRLDEGTDERLIVEALAAAEPNVELCFAPQTASDLADLLSTDLTMHPVATLRYEMRASREAASRGVGVVLSGWGGDEAIAFNGRGYFSDLARRGHWITLTRELKLRAAIHPVVWWGIRRKVVIPLLPDPIVHRLLPQHAGGRVRRSFPRCLAPELIARLSEVELPRRRVRERPGRRRMQQTLLDLGHLNFRAESWSDWGSNVGVEYRFPALDRRVVEFALGAPDWLYFRNGWKRYAFRKAMDGFVPAEARWKKAKGDPAMVLAASRLAEPAMDLFRPRLLQREANVRQAGLVDWEKLVSGYAPHGSADCKWPQATQHDSARACWLAFTDGQAP